MLERIIGEAIGTFMFCFIIAVAEANTTSNYSGNISHPYSLGGGAIILMMLAGFTADPHLNPAITLGHYTRHIFYKGFDFQAIYEHSLIIIVQFIAAIPGAYLGWGLNDSMIYFTPSFESDHNKAFLAELVFTMLIVGTALMIGKTKDSRILGSIGLGAAYFGGVLCVSYYSGACFNPALGLAINLANYSDKHNHFSDTWIYVVAPMVGGVLGGIFNSCLLVGAKDAKIIGEDNELILRDS